MGVTGLLEKTSRPKSLFGTCTQEEVGCGHLLITINGNGHGPTEVFATLGKAGGCSSCQNEALTRTITLGLRYGLPAMEFINELEGIQCPNPKMFPQDDRCLSCPDAIAKALRNYIKGQGK